MCDNFKTAQYNPDLIADAKDAQTGRLNLGEHHTVYELRKQIDFHVHKILDIQKAIDAINKL